MIRRLLCFVGLHDLMTNVYGPHECIYTCVDCGRQRWIDER